MERIRATYRLAVGAAEAKARAQALAAEQSVEMPIDAIADARVLRDVVATVESLEPRGEDFEAVLAIAPATTGFEASQLLNMLFGNCSLQSDVELVDVAFPAGYEAMFRGPRFGIDGIRDLVHARARAVTCTALKPQGSSLEHLAALARTFALAGIDVVKDDHGIANQSPTPFAERVPAIQRAIAAANRETGGHTVYAPTFSGGARALAEQARIARHCGVRMALVAPMLVGAPALVELCETLDMPVIAHPAYAGASRVAPAVLLGALFRLFGADATIFPNHGGRFAYTRETCLAIADRARRPWGELKPTLPVPAGGMSIERVPEMLAGYGERTMLLIGGGLLSAGDRLLERAKAFVERVHAGGGQ